MSENLIGYIAVSADGLPYQPTLGKDWQARTKPITVYKYEKYAKQFTGYAIPVYTRDVNE